MVVGSGDKARLWIDIKVDNSTLKVAFPRVFALACNKKGIIGDYGRWENSRWI